MLRAMSGLKGLKVRATDGDAGTVHDVYFDGHRWTVRYFVVDTGSWLSGRRVLLSPMALRGGAVRSDGLDVGITKAQIEAAPEWDADQPVSRQHEVALAGHYAFPYYWDGPGLWGAAWDPYAPIAAATRTDPVQEELAARAREAGDPNLHSARDVMGYYIEAVDGDIGHVEDFLVDDRTWAVRYMVVDTRNWLPGRTVLVSPRWIRSVSWDESKVHVDLERDQVKASPEYDRAATVERELEARLHAHYGRPPYWDEERER